MRKHTNPIDEWLAGAFGAIFPAIPKPDPLAPINVTRVSLLGGELKVERIDPRDFYMAPVDADETNYGPCAQGDCSDE